MCNKGRRQSPINVEPDKLLFDPYLRSLHIDKHKVGGGTLRWMDLWIAEGDDEDNFRAKSFVR